MTEAEKWLMRLVRDDNKPHFITQAKRILQNGSEGLDRRTVSKLLHLCCSFDSADCASALLNGELGLVPLVNEMDETGRSVLHAAADKHAALCIELLLRKHARTDLKTKDGRALLALNLSLSSTRLDVSWNPDENSVEDLVVALSEKDLRAVRLLVEKTKELSEVAYANAVDGGIVGLAAMLIAAPNKVNELTVEFRDANSGIKEKTSIYECVINKALSLAHSTTRSTAAKRSSSTLTESENTELRKLLLCEIELLQLFGVVAKTGSTEKRMTSPLIRAAQAGDEAVTELLLKTNIDISDADVEGNSALHWCLKMSRGSSSQQMKILCLLLKHGAKVSQKNKLGLTALHIAAANGKAEALQVLLLYDREVINSKSETKETPLFFAVKNDSMECAELLLRWGANSEVLNLRRQRPVDLAKTQDMRFMLNPTNISVMTRAFPNEQKNSNWLQNKEANLETCKSFLPMPERDIITKRFSSSTSEICKYFKSPGGCVRGDKCLYAHTEEELMQMKQRTQPNYFPATMILKRKIFVGGVPASVNSDSLGKFFEEQFGFVEDAVVIGAPAGDYIQSRGFGFVTFRDEKSVSAAVEAHYVTMMGKQVEIKSAMPKCFFFTEFQEFFFQKQEKEKNNCIHLEAEVVDARNTEEATTEQLSWIEKLLNGLPTTCSSELQLRIKPSTVDRSMPKWLQTFIKWLPGFLQNLTKHPKEGDYPLSSLKGDFRAKFGLELDHASLGFPKLSDFMKSFSVLCRMKVVPIGRHGSPNHMVLIPMLPSPHQQLLQARTMPCAPSNDTSIDNRRDEYSEDHKFLQKQQPNQQPLHTPSAPCASSNFASVDNKNDEDSDHKFLQKQLSHQQPHHTSPMPCSPLQDKSVNDGNDDDSIDNKYVQDHLSGCYEDIGTACGSAKETNSSYMCHVFSSAQKDTLPCEHPRFLQFLKPDPLFYARPWLPNQNNARDTDDERGSCEKGAERKNFGHPQKHLVLEALARKKKNSSIFFLREFDFYKNYDACIAQGKCFACNQQKMLWVNFPCQHYMWCSDCKLQAIRAAGSSEHKCVVCDMELQKFCLIPVHDSQSLHFPNYEEFPPFDPNHLRSSSEKKKSPLVGLGRNGCN